MKAITICVLILGLILVFVGVVARPIAGAIAISIEPAPLSPATLAVGDFLYRYWWAFLTSGVLISLGAGVWLSRKYPVDDPHLTRR
jgi:hypothetical protein